jgi:hypothetical protein
LLCWSTIERFGVPGNKQEWIPLRRELGGDGLADPVTSAGDDD